MHAVTRHLARSLLLAALLAGPGAVSADDGVIEIDHTRALQGGVSPVDLPGYPITVVEGSYRLTGPLAPQQATSAAIEIQLATSVEIDLAGFAISGGGSCSFSAPSLSCAPGPAPVAIAADAGIFLVIRNGFLQGFQAGVETGGNSLHAEVILEDVTLIDVEHAVSYASSLANRQTTFRRISAIRSALFAAAASSGESGVIQDVALQSGELADSTIQLGLARRVAALNASADLSVQHVEQWVSSGDTDGRLVTNNLHRSLIVNGTDTEVFARLVTDSVIWGNVGTQAVLSAEALANSIVTANPAGNILGTVVELGDNVCGGCP